MRVNAKICAHLSVFLAMFQQQTLGRSGHAPSTNCFSVRPTKHVCNYSVKEVSGSSLQRAHVQFHT